MSMFYELMMKKKGIPSRYQEVEYIESDETQYINTGLVPKTTFKYKIKYSLNATGNQVLFGSRTSGTFDTSRNQIYFNANNNAEGGAKTYLLNIFDVNNVNLNIVPTQNVIVETPIMQNENCIIENATQPIYLFALNNRGIAVVFAKTKMYYYQIYDNSSLIRNFIPVYDTETQKYGMWESVQRKFYGNAGIGDFKGSIVGYTIVGSPTIVDGVVSGFSASDYLQLNEYLPSTDNFEAVIDFTTGNSFNTNETLFRLAQICDIEYFQSNYTTYNWYLGGNSSIISRPQTNTRYVVKFVKNSNVVDIYLSTDGNDFTLTKTIDVGTKVQNSNISFGTSLANLGRYFNGSININNTYIKVNGKLWFNGQQA